MANVTRWSEPSPPPPPDEHVDRVLYGVMQPVLAMRLLASDRELRSEALKPAFLLAGFCALVALTHLGDGPREMLRNFYQTFAVLAPLPSLFLAPFYARLAVKARAKLGFAPAEPCIEPLSRGFKRWVAQAILIALAIAPASLLLRLVPVLGGPARQLLIAAWGLHWIVVDAFDSARYLKPGQTLADLDAEAAVAPTPWFVRALRHAAAHAPMGGGLLTRLASFCDRLAVPWREELALVERHPSLAGGFTASTALLLATPVLNLLFRPIVLIAAVHVIGRLESAREPVPAHD
jgi:hypothetical protein